MEPRAWLFILAAGSFAPTFCGCMEDHSLGDQMINNNNNEKCNYDGICDSPHETRFNCEDCFDITCRTDQGDRYDYIVNQLVVPDLDHENIGVDLDGDGIVDNRLGDILGIIPSGELNANESIAWAIRDGHFVLLVRLMMDSFQDDYAMAFQLFLGDPTADATEDNLTGSGHAAIHEDSSRDLHLCGSVINGYMDAGPGILQVAMSLEDLSLILMLDRAMAVSEDEISAEGLSRMMIGGGISRQALETEIIPALLLFLNRKIIEDPEGDLAVTILDMADGPSCDSSVPGCEDVVAGEDECAAWDQDPDNPPLTLTELSCNALMAAVLAPDVDFDGDGENEHISLGIQVSAVPVTIDN